MNARIANIANRVALSLSSLPATYHQAVEMAYRRSRTGSCGKITVAEELVKIAELLSTKPSSSKIAMPVFEKAPGFDVAFQEFFAFCHKVYNDYMEQQFPNNPRDTMEFREGGRYVKITQNSGSVFLFVDKVNGDILKAATWSAPARHARGNIFDKASWKNAVTAYGAAYLR
jgi:hypothetical protein